MVAAIFCPFLHLQSYPVHLPASILLMLAPEQWGTAVSSFLRDTGGATGWENAF